MKKPLRLPKEALYAPPDEQAELPAPEVVERLGGAVDATLTLELREATDAEMALDAAMLERYEDVN